jgi:hypothetical protein
MQTTIADYVLSNPSNINNEDLGTNDPAAAKAAFEVGLDFDTTEDAADPTVVYIKNENIVAWYDRNAMVGFK